MNGVKRAIDGKHLAFMPLEPMARTQPKAIDSLALGDLLVMVSDAIFSHLSCHLCNANQHFQRKNSRKEYVSTYAIPFLFFFFFYLSLQYAFHVSRVTPSLESSFLRCREDQKTIMILSYLVFYRDNSTVTCISETEH